MKERSRAVAMMVLHMSSHIASGGQYVAQHCHFSRKRQSLSGSKCDMKQEPLFDLNTVDL